MIEALILFATLGIFAGLIAGMFGVGGGIITVPVLVACFIQYDFEDAIMTHMAVGTSLGCIVFTGISSAYAHRQKNAINYKFFKPIALGIVIGAFLGALFAVQLNGNILKIIIGIFALFVAIQMGINREIEFKQRAKRNKEPYFVGTGIGFTSSILGIGGGIFSVPYLKASGLTMTSSIGTSAACGIPIAIFGALGYIGARYYYLQEVPADGGQEVVRGIGESDGVEGERLQRAARCQHRLGICNGEDARLGGNAF